MTIDGSDGTLEHAERSKMALAMTMYGEAPILEMTAMDGEGSYLAAIPEWSNVVGFGYGLKWTASAISAMDAIRVYVRTKLPKSEIADRDRVPDEIEGVPTDVIAVGEITAAFPRPMLSGVSGAHQAVDNGTLGCLVTRQGGGQFILSNNHVLANVNGTGDPDDILEPSRTQGGGSNPRIARLTDFKKILLNTTMKNEIDAAIARLEDPPGLTPAIKGIGRVNPAPLAAAKLMSVRKHGAVTQHRVGVVDGLSEDISVVYPGIGVAKFHKQIAVMNTAEGPFADRGDSGALVVESVTLRPVGLLFAVSTPRTFCNPIEKVLSAFGATVL